MQAPRQIYVLYPEYIAALESALLKHDLPPPSSEDNTTSKSDIHFERKLLWISSRSLTQGLNAIALTHNKMQTVLGREFHCIIYDAQEDFYPNAFGAVTGTLCAAGILLILLPHCPTADKQHTMPRSWQRLFRLIHSNDTIQCIDSNTALQDFIDALAKQKYTKKNTLIEPNTEQEQVIAAIIKVAKGHRNRPLVLSADRGRGKSAALGMAAKQLLAQGLNNIYVTAHTRAAVDSVFKHADYPANLYFIAPDELLKQRPSSALLLIDEAAAIPSNLLTRMLQHYRRIVFSTTLHGYEGTGRGFEIRFQKILQQYTPQWRAIKLHTPIRWAQYDPLETFVYQTLLLNAQQSAIPEPSLVYAAHKCVIQKIPRDTLLTNETLLQQIFGLLVSAHYQTKPADLHYLLDHPDVSVFVIQYDAMLLATALSCREGGFDTHLAEAVYQGKRRIKGHLIAQSLTFHAGIADAACWQAERIIRIAVHSAYQRQGLASQLIQFIASTYAEQRDYLGVSFAASIEMLQFWHKQGFYAVRVGLKRDASSGTHSVIKLHPLSKNGARLLYNTQQRFYESLPHLLSEPLADLDSEIIRALFTTNVTAAKVQLSTWQWAELEAFGHTHRGYELCISSLWQWLIQAIKQPEFTQLTPQHQGVLISKILQKRSWSYIVAHYQFTGKKAAITYLKATLKHCLSHNRYHLNCL